MASIHQRPQLQVRILAYCPVYFVSLKSGSAFEINSQTVWLTRWLGSEENCGLCERYQVSLHYILSDCKFALAQGCNRWRHDQVLRKLAEHTENMEVLANRKPQCLDKQRVQFVPAGQTEQNRPQREEHQYWPQEITGQ